MQTDLQKELLDLETQFWNCMKTKDVEAALKLTNDPCIVTGAQGVSRIDKQTFARLCKPANGLCMISGSRTQRWSSSATMSRSSATRSMKS